MKGPKSPETRAKLRSATRAYWQSAAGRSRLQRQRQTAAQRRQARRKGDREESAGNPAE